MVTRDGEDNTEVMPFAVMKSRYGLWFKKVGVMIPGMNTCI